MTPRQKVNSWTKRLRRAKTSQREWEVKYFARERRYKVRGQFTADDGDPERVWKWYSVAQIERVITEFEASEGLREWPKDDP